MPALWLGLGMGALQGGMALFGGSNEAEANAAAAFQQAEAANHEAWKNKRQWEHGEFLSKMQNQIKNRETSKVNAQRWMKNQKIAEAANQNRAEEEFWIRWNFDNDAERISKKHQQVNNELVKSLDKRNINMRSGNARALLRATLDTSTDQMAQRRVSAKNQLRSAERKQLAALSQRDFGYNSHTVHIPGLYLAGAPVDAQAAYDSAYSTGMTSALVSGISGAAQGAFQGVQMGHSLKKMYPETFK
tara:strand:+ start:221 stop:958 length:738 start_codon:yes stop_codon:yes gene_type:complete